MHSDTVANIIKNAICWLLVALGSLTRAEVATYLAIVYTSLQIFVTVRDKFIRRAGKPDGL